MVRKEREAVNMEWLKNRAVKVIEELKQRDQRDLQVSFGKLFLEIVMWKQKGAGFLLVQ